MATVFPVSRHLSNQVQHLLIPTCGFVGVLSFCVIQNQIDNKKTSLSVGKNHQQKPHWSACIGKPLHRILPRSYLTFGTSPVDLPRLCRQSKFEKTSSNFSAQKFEALTIGCKRHAPTGFEPEHCKRWNTFANNGQKKIHEKNPKKQQLFIAPWHKIHFASTYGIKAAGRSISVHPFASA